jgi:ketosteroid isomerase-like protein
MKTLLASLALLFVVQAFAAENPQLAAVQAADKARIDAMQSGDGEKLSAIFSDKLRYAHSNGDVDTKASFIDILSAGKTKYVGYDYEEQGFTFPSPGIALMTGRAHVKAESEGKTMDAVLSFLAVWRQEKGRWRFLAWQSCKLPSVVK